MTYEGITVTDFRVTEIDKEYTDDAVFVSVIGFGWVHGPVEGDS